MVHTSVVDAQNCGYDKNFKFELKWRKIILLIYFHVTFIYGLGMLFRILPSNVLLSTIIYNIVIIYLSGFGLTAGAHRLWCHRSYTANFNLRILLMVLQSFAFQTHIFEWVRDHRCHHKFTDTDADPSNAKRGFFFSHVGWLCIKKHPKVRECGRTIDMEDVEKDPIISWQKRNHIWFLPLLGFVIHTFVPIAFFGETLHNAWTFRVVGWVITNNRAWLVNSAGHSCGTKPYDKNISATNSAVVGFFAIGEGWHNYHHVFPWDYKTSELIDFRYNFTNAFIEFFARIGWAYDLKTVSPEVIFNQIKKSGDGSTSYTSFEGILNDSKEVSFEEYKKLIERKNL